MALYLPPILYRCTHVLDKEATIAFYEKALGLKVAREFGPADGSWTNTYRSGRGGFAHVRRRGGGGPYFHDQIVYCDDTPGSKVQMSTYRRDLGIRIHAARKARMRRLSYEWLAGLREIVIDSTRCPLTFAEFTLKE